MTDKEDVKRSGQQEQPTKETKRRAVKRSGEGNGQQEQAGDGIRIDAEHEPGTETAAEKRAKRETEKERRERRKQL